MPNIILDDSGNFKEMYDAIQAMTDEEFERYLEKLETSTK